ncbi:MAG: DUF1887 family protein [Deltaproteobacteria bacterium]|nr:DUF1887 family protein [Deltaproteobacteria bacterium]
MKTCLVSLVSDQTIPNILITAAIRPDYLLLLSTASMEKKNKSQAILNCLSILNMDYHNHSSKIIVPEGSVPDFYEKVIEWLKSNRNYYQFITNLTGGTKLMSLAAYEIFKSYGADMVYMPIPKNLYFRVHRPNDPIPVPIRLSVEAYLTAYNVSIENRKILDELKQEAHDRKHTTYFLFDHYKEIEPLLQQMGRILRSLKRKDVKKGYDFLMNYLPESPVEKNLLGKLGFAYAGGAISKRIDASDWNYLRGGWLEERVFLAIESILPGDNSDICLGLHCRINGNDNEYDVLFTYENILYVVECKSLKAPMGSEKQERGGTINDFLYKLGALRQNFGLTPKGILATTSNNVLDKNGNIKPHLLERGKLFNTQIVPLRQISDLEGWLKEKIMK